MIVGRKWGEGETNFEEEKKSPLFFFELNLFNKFCIIGKKKGRIKECRGG